MSISNRFLKGGATTILNYLLVLKPWNNFVSLVENAIPSLYPFFLSFFPFLTPYFYFFLPYIAREEILKEINEQLETYEEADELDEDEVEDLLNYIDWSEEEEIFDVNDPPPVTEEQFIAARARINARLLNKHTQGNNNNDNNN